MTNATALRMTITKTGTTRYSFFSRRAFRQMPMGRTQAEAEISQGLAVVVEIADFLNGDGQPMKVADACLN